MKCANQLNLLFHAVSLMKFFATFETLSINFTIIGSATAIRSTAVLGIQVNQYNSLGPDKTIMLKLDGLKKFPVHRAGLRAK